MNIERANLIVATRATTDAAMQMLVGKKLRGDFEGDTTFPGGKLIWGEGALEDKTTGAQREFEEETGIVLPREAFRLAGRIRLFGDRFGFIDIFHAVGADQEPKPNDEIEMAWRTVDEHFYDGMPEDTPEWLPLVFETNSFRMNSIWKVGKYCGRIIDPLLDGPLNILRYFEHAQRPAV